MKLTKNFSRKEFECKDGSPMTIAQFENIKELAKNLQVLRDALDKPIHITNAYRSRNHNQSVGGSKTSQHILGKAADIYVEDLTPKELAKVIEGLIEEGKMSEGGIGIYTKNKFLHYDIRGFKARWNG